MPGMRARKHKYNARKTLYNGVWYDSALEAKIAADIDLLIKSGKVKHCDRQRQFILWGAGQTAICIHRVDFYLLFEDHDEVWEAKGFATPEWKLKRKLFLDNYPNIKYVVHSKNKKLQTI